MHYGITAWNVDLDGTLTTYTSPLVDALAEPDAPPAGFGVFFGDFVLREHPERTH